MNQVSYDRKTIAIIRTLFVCKNIFLVFLTVPLTNAKRKLKDLTAKGFYITIRLSPRLKEWNNNFRFARQFINLKSQKIELE